MSDASADLQTTLRAMRPRQDYWLTRWLLLRSLGFIYFVAFLSLFDQLLPLIGSDGLMPAASFLDAVLATSSSGGEAFWELPTLFWVNVSDPFLIATCGLGVALSALVTLGFANVPILTLLWVLYLSFTHIGQTFYQYGWEILLLESGFLALFLSPLLSPKPFSPSPPNVIVLVLFRWLVFRLMFGAGLIKLRGDSCWTDLTCLVYHYETQPNPNPLSWALHQAPLWFQQLGVLFNHLVELVVPFGVFGPRRVRLVAGCLVILFQVTLILSGNLSFLNWLSIAIAVSCFDDGFLRSILARMGAFGRELLARAEPRIDAAAEVPETGLRRGFVIAYAIVVAMLSLNPVANLLGTSQRMNASFDPFHLVNTYGAFGTVGRERHEVIVEGTLDAIDDDPEQATWLAYEFPCKPGALDRAPCVVTPYHYRLQWQMWFASFGTPNTEPWLPHLVAQLLEGNPTALELVETNPFPDAPPRYIRARLFRYQFTTFGEAGWWKREYVGQWLRPLRRDDPELHRFLQNHNW